MAGYYDHDDAVDDFDEFDPEPYSGGYDQMIAYGKPISPSEDTCYNPSVPNQDEDESHRFAYGSESCPYGGDCIDEERPMHETGSEPSYERPKPPQKSFDFDEPQPYAADEFGQRPPSRPPHEEQEEESGYSEGWKKPSYGEEGEEPRYDRGDSEEGGQDSYRKPHRPSYTREEEEASPRFESPEYRQDEGYERPEYGGEEYEERSHERPAYHQRRDSYTEE